MTAPIAQRKAKPTAAEEKRAYRIVTERDEGRCQKCLRDCGPVQRDHRQNRQDGNTIPENLQLLGLRCHEWKSTHPKDALDQGWAVPRWADPKEWPARRWLPSNYGMVRKAWVVYTSFGSWREISAAEAARRMGRTA